MDQLEMLWNYQQVDMEADRFEREMRADPDRQKLLKQRDFLMEQQNTVKRIESEVSVMTDRMEGIADEVVRLQDNLGELMQQAETLSEDDMEGILKLEGAVQKLMGTITRYEGELVKMRKDAEARDKQQHEVRVRAAKVKGDFDTLKSGYDEKYKEQSAELEQLKQKANAASKGIDEKLLERYNAIKKHSTPPMAKLNDDRCGGCNMSLPSVVLHKIRSGSDMVECENCGRIILVK